MKTIIRIDASSIKESSCFRRFYLLTHEGYTEGQTNNDTHYGSCIHRCVETYALTGGDEYAAVTAAQDLWRQEEPRLHIKSTKKFLNITHLTFACQKFLQQVKTSSTFTDIIHLKDAQGRAMVEQKFSIPLYEDDKLLILLQGTIDALVQIRGGCICVDDWKSTSRYDIEEFFASFKLSPQLKVYLYALQYYRDNYPESYLGKLLVGKGQLGCIIHGAFLSAGEIVKYQRSEPYFFSPVQMKEFKSELDSLVSRIVGHHTLNLGKIPRAEGTFNGACSIGHEQGIGFKCKFHAACAAEALAQGNGGEATMRHVLNSTFRKREYKPFSFGGGHNKANLNETNGTNECQISGGVS